MVEHGLARFYTGVFISVEREHFILVHGKCVFSYNCIHSLGTVVMVVKTNIYFATQLVIKAKISFR